MAEYHINKRLLKAKLILAGITCTDYARHMGWTKTTLYNRMNGKTEYVASDIGRTVALLQLTPQEAQDIFFQQSETAVPIRPHYRLVGNDGSL